MTLTKTTCPYCGVGCGVLAGADSTIEGDPNHPANFGRLCSKGSALGETISLEGRLLHPVVNGAQADWDTALDLVADKFSAAVAEHGPESVAFYVSGQILTEDYYIANKLMKGYIGSANIDTNSRLCMASSVAGHKRAFGTDTVPGTYEDLEEADLVVLVGSNLAWCHPVLFQRLQAAKEARPDMRVVNIDPRRTATSEIADTHLHIAPDGDIALFNGLLTHLVKTGKVDHAYVEAYVNGFEDALRMAAQSDLSAAGLPEDQITAFYEQWARAEKVVTVYSQGVNQSAFGSNKVNAIINCHLATGRIGRPGMGPFSVTGQPNAMGGREVGGLANMLANHLDIENEAHRDTLQSFWASPTMCTKPDLKAVDLFQACADGKIKALWIMSTNPAVSLPNANAVAAAIENVPFTVVSDILERTDTGDLANVLLPAAAWGEKSGTVTNSERRISRQRPFMPAPGKAKPDWDILCEVGKRMGWAQAFDYDGPGEIFAEYVALSKAAKDFDRDLDLTEFAGIDYDTMPPMQWPRNDSRFFAKGGFYHADGKAKMLSIPAPKPDNKDGYRLNTGRTRDQWHTMTRTGRAPRLGRHLAEPFVEIHTQDAADLGIESADLVALSGAQSTAIFRAFVTDKVPIGNFFAPMHWTRMRTGGSWVNGVIDVTTDPTSGQPASKGGHVHAQKFSASWYGFWASTAQMDVHGDYCAISLTDTGWQVELAGTQTPDDWPAYFEALTADQDGEVTYFTDDAKGIHRFARVKEGTLTDLFYCAPSPVALSRPMAIGLIGTQTEPFAALAAWPSADMPDPGAIVCSCMSVGVNTLRDAVENGATTVQNLAECTSAGTSCGSCKPELKALIASCMPALAAE